MFCVACGRAGGRENRRRATTHLVTGEEKGHLHLVSGLLERRQHRHGLLIPGSRVGSAPVNASPRGRALGPS